MLFISAALVFYFINKEADAKDDVAEDTPMSEEVMPDTKKEGTEEMIEVVVDDATGEILGIKANEVGDYYIINPQNEVMINKEGHSTKFVPSI